MRAGNRLSAAFVKRAPAAKWCEGSGVWLVKRPDGGARRVLRPTVDGLRRKMGRGGADVSLAQAREMADRWRAMAVGGLRSGAGPRGRDRCPARGCEPCRRNRRLQRGAQGEPRGRRQGRRRLSPLETRVMPKPGGRAVTGLDRRDIRDMLVPVWHMKAEVARKALNRLSIVLRHAAAPGIGVDLQACEKAWARLGTSRQAVRHIPAMPWRDVPAFYDSLDEPSPVNLARRLLILTGVRSAPLRLLRLAVRGGRLRRSSARRWRLSRRRVAPARGPASEPARWRPQRQFVVDPALRAGQVGPDGWPRPGRPPRPGQNRNKRPNPPSAGARPR